MFMVNKYVIHDGTHYQKDSEIKEGDKGFSELSQKGHVYEVKAQAPVQSENKPAEQQQSKKQSSKK